MSEKVNARKFSFALKNTGNNKENALAPAKAKMQCMSCQHLWAEIELMYVLKI